MYLTLEWTEPRYTFQNETAVYKTYFPRLVLTNNTDVWNMDESSDFELDLAHLTDFWIPDLEIHRTSQFRRPQAIKEVGGLLISSDKVVAFTVNAYVTVECPFEYKSYPMDIQVKEAKFCLSSVQLCKGFVGTLENPQSLLNVILKMPFG